jgi:hypothetical protein
VAGCCEHSNEYRGSVIGESFRLAELHSASQEWLYALQVVT